MVKVDNVYQKVLALANKEQRGYITPQEFNLFADQAQMEIFEQYFYDLSQFERRPGSNTQHVDLKDMIEEKLARFVKSMQANTGSPTPMRPDYVPDFYKLDSVYLSNGNTFEVLATVEKVTVDEIINVQTAPLTKATNRRPLYRFSNHALTFNPPENPLGNYIIFYKAKPKKPNWTYVIDPTTKNALYNPNASDHQDFELHPAEESKLVIKILQLTGVNMKDYNLVQVAGQKEVSVIQQEKQ